MFLRTYGLSDPHGHISPFFINITHFLEANYHSIYNDGNSPSQGTGPFHGSHAVAVLMDVWATPTGGCWGRRPVLVAH